MIKDIIQQAVDEETDKAIKRYQKHIEYTIAQANKKRKLHKKKRKMERQNRRKARC